MRKGAWKVSGRHIPVGSLALGVAVSGCQVIVQRVGRSWGGGSLLGRLSPFDQGDLSTPQKFCPLAEQPPSSP